MNTPLVNLHIIGVQKAGTSALAHFLSQHPDVCVVEGKEAHVFDQPDFASKDKHEFAKKRYEKKLSHYQGEKIICDATPITMFNKAFMQDCYNYNPQAKFIVLLRNPVDRAVSHFYMSKQRGREHSNMLWSFLKEGDRLKKASGANAWITGSAWRDNSYLARGMYKKQLNNLSLTAPNEQCLITTQETLLQKHDNTLARIFSFLEIPEQTILAEQVFTSDIQEKDSSEGLARAYAVLYFLINGEYPYRYR